MKLKLLKPLPVRVELLRRNIGVFTPREFRLIFGTAKLSTKYFLETYTRKGLFIRLKQGLYSLADHLPCEEEVGNILYLPSYISFEYALAKYGLIPEMVYSVSSATTKPTRSFTVKGRQFTYLTIKKKAFTGYLPVMDKGRAVLMAEPEKALADYLYFVSIGKKTLNDRLNLKNISRKKIRKYAALYERPGLIKLINSILL